MNNQCYLCRTKYFGLVNNKKIPIKQNICIGVIRETLEFRNWAQGLRSFKFLAPPGPPFSTSRRFCLGVTGVTSNILHQCAANKIH